MADAGVVEATASAAPASLLLPRIAVMLPCHNEEQAVAATVEGFRRALPGAVIHVYDNNSRDRTRAVAEAYLKYLYTEEGQDIAGKHFYRPAISDKAKAKYAAQFPKLALFTIDEAFGGWSRAAKEHFADGAHFDQIYTKK